MSRTRGLHSATRSWSDRPGWLTVAALVLPVVLAMVLATTPADVSAADDAGVRSVFARGAGARALSLGAAYGAVTGDPSVVFYNPGSLALMDRRQIQATHTNLIGLGFSEQYLACGWSSWRWGVTSLTFRRFGVDGIDGRDVDNMALTEEIKDNETEIMLGYGRRLGSAWGVGGALKMQRQSLAGLSDTGFGIDLGVHVKPLVAAGSSLGWADGLAVGLAVRNLVEPKIRLDEESVPDPTGVRLGLAFARPFWEKGALQATVDVEKTADMNTNLHLGLEVQLLSKLALRLGSNAGTLTAGAGVNWRDIAVDYSFEDNLLDSVHRLGIGFAFGRTVTESRQLAVAAEEAELQARLASAFEGRNRQRIGDLEDQIEASLAGQRFDEALQTLAILAVLDPEHGGLTGWKAAAYRDRGLTAEEADDLAAAEIDLNRALSLVRGDEVAADALRRVRFKSDQKQERSSMLRGLLNEAMDAFARDDLLAARDGFTEVLYLAPEDREASTLLQRTQEALRSRAQNLVETARILVQAGQYEEAATALDQARGLDPWAEGLDQVTALLGSERRAAARRRAEQEQAVAAAAADIGAAEVAAAPAPVAAAASRPPLSPERRREIGELYRLGMGAMEEGRADDAIHFLEVVWSADPGWQQVSPSLKREYLTRGMEAFASGKLQAAMGDWEKVLEIDPADERALGYLDRARQQMSKIQQISQKGR